MLAWVVASFALQSALQLAFAPEAVGAISVSRFRGRNAKIAPKVFIIDMFDSEGDAWNGIPEFNVLEHNITIPGFSSLFPQAHCTKDGSICQLVTGEAEINAASTITALVHSPVFDLKETYFFIAGIAGISPKVGTLGSATFAQFAVQVALQFEFDAREKPANFSTGYVPQGSTSPDEFPQSLYGTEVFAVNDNLRQLAIKMAKTGKLFDDAPSQAYRANYANNSAFAAGAAPPSVVACDTATSDVFWTGDLLGAAFENTTKLFTNGSATYCTTQQEDNATLEALLRGALTGLVDFARVIVMRTASDFDRPFDGQSPAANLFDSGDPGFEISIQNIAAAGVPVVTGIVKEWTSTFKKGIKPTSYIGDIFGTLGGTPSFGPGSIFGGKKAPTKRSLRRRGVRSVVRSV
ncbi:purine nucleoside permease [Phanerochaete sordida]|uniref:Purine nucleoside permease n=1 Tax=Phanerochaete sordida TaxID=48140 RepID=A0A9P3GS40_9APHY|nr:purine nucleoside permease [Phanerochaete sordida]